MKKGLLILFCAALVTSAQAQWSKTIETPTKTSFATTSSAIAVAPSGETFVAGSLSKDDVRFGNTTLNFENTGDSFLFKYSSTGEPVWANVINGESTHISAITFDNEGNIYVAGTYQGETATVFNGQENTKETATCNFYEDVFFGETIYFQAGFIAKYSSDGKLVKLSTFKADTNEAPETAFYYDRQVTFSIQNLQYANGKLYASAIYGGKTEKDGFSFEGKLFGSDMASDVTSGCVIAVNTNDLTIDAKLADLSPNLTENANSLYSVTDVKTYVNANHVYAIFQAMAEMTLTVGSTTDNISIPTEPTADDVLYSRAYILADVNTNGTLNQKMVYASIPEEAKDFQNTIGAIAEKDGKIIVTGLFNEYLPFKSSLACSGKFDFYAATINPTDLSVVSAQQGNIATPTMDPAKKEYITVYPTGAAISSNKIYATVDYGFSTRNAEDKVVTTYSSYAITYDFNTVQADQQATNVYTNGVGVCDNKVVTATINITNREFDEGDLIVTQTVDGESSIDNAVADKVAVKAYPNPVSDILNFSEACDVTIVNGQGSEVKSVSATTQISVADLAAGYYIAKIKTADGTTVIPFIKK